MQQINKFVYIATIKYQAIYTPQDLIIGSPLLTILSISLLKLMFDKQYLV